MKKSLVLNWLMLSMPCHALAHPGHDADAALAGLAGAYLPGAVAAAGALLGFVALRRYRRRKATRADG